ncbi:BON1-associated protein 2 [Diospyros lotus]|uniref:BON1-associated protein 2 n=1 Tax=Diospyros lotus TaxID=55363 RepID=UPI0022569F18|nr:BON1-associated protein 2 [Diospyros lotus]
MANSRVLEVTIISGEGLPAKKNAFVVVRADPWTSTSTKVDSDGGSYPQWNEKLAVDLPARSQFLMVEVQCKTYSGNKVVGTARIPVSDFTGEYFPANYLHLLSYRLRDSSGVRSGIINLSVRMKVPENALAAAATSCGAASSYSRPWTGYPVAEKSGGVVIGVPAWSRY